MPLANVMDSKALLEAFSPAGLNSPEELSENKLRSRCLVVLSKIWKASHVSGNRACNDARTPAAPSVCQITHESSQFGSFGTPHIPVSS